jgi:hypothetical protein
LAASNFVIAAATIPTLSGIAFENPPSVIFIRCP